MRKGWCKPSVFLGSTGLVSSPGDRVQALALALAVPTAPHSAMRRLGGNGRPSFRCETNGPGRTPSLVKSPKSPPWSHRHSQRGRAKPYCRLTEHRGCEFFASYHRVHGFRPAPQDINPRPQFSRQAEGIGPGKKNEPPCNSKNTTPPVPQGHIGSIYQHLKRIGIISNGLLFFSAGFFH